MNKGYLKWYWATLFTFLREGSTQFGSAARHPQSQGDYPGHNHVFTVSSLRAVFGLSTSSCSIFDRTFLVALCVTFYSGFEKMPCRLILHEPTGPLAFHELGNDLSWMVFRLVILVSGFYETACCLDYELMRPLTFHELGNLLSWMVFRLVILVSGFDETACCLD